MWKFTDFLQVHGQIMFIVSFLLRFSYTQNFVTQDNNKRIKHSFPCINVCQAQGQKCVAARTA